MTPKKDDDASVAEINKRLDEIFGESPPSESIQDEQPDEAAAQKTEEETEEPAHEQETQKKEARAEDEIELELDLEEETTESPFNDLKRLVLSLDWEIKDDTLIKFIQEIEKQKKSYKNDQVILVFLHLLGLVGRYIKNKKSNAHPSAVKLLETLFSKLEKVALNQELNFKQKKKILLQEVEKFRKLKDVIAREKREKAAAAQASEQIQPEEQAASVEDVTRKAEKRINAHMEAAVEKIDLGPEKEELQPETDQAKPADTKISNDNMAFLLDEIKKVIKTEFEALKKELQHKSS